MEIMPLPPAIVSLVLLVAMIGLLFAGLWLGRRFKSETDTRDSGVVAVSAFVLVALLVAAAFSSAIQRLDSRRELMAAEANAISTAYLRIDLIAPADLRGVMKLFPLYLSARIAAYRMMDSGSTTQAAFASADDLESQIWTMTGAAMTKPDRQFAVDTVLPAISNMIETSNARKIALGVQTPDVVLYTLFGVSLIGSLIVGYALAGQGRRGLIQGGLFAAAVSLTTFAILEIDNPRGAFMQLDSAEQMLKALQDIMRID